MPQDPDLLDQLIEEATVDCYDDEECRIGFFTLLEDNLEIPSKAKLGGSEVVITGLDCDGRVIKAMVEQASNKYPIDILDLAISPHTAGSEWVRVYYKWEK